MPIKAVLFDLDGTLLDTAPDFVSTVNQLREEENLPPLAEDAIRRSVSNGARSLVTLAFNLRQGDAGFDELLQRLLNIYSSRLTVDTKPFPGIEDLLIALQQQQILWGLVTNKPFKFTQAILESLQFRPPPSTVVCPDHVSNTKPDPEPLLLACRQINCRPEEIIYVGDHKRDVDCGKNAGAVTIAVSYGYIDENDSPNYWQADYLVDSAQEIENIVLQQCHN